METKGQPRLLSERSIDAGAYELTIDADAFGRCAR